MRRKMPWLPIFRFAHGISTSFLPRFGVVKGVVSSLLNLSINERGGGAAAPSAGLPLATSLDLASYYYKNFSCFFRDRDGIQDNEDNCPNSHNAAQLDNDSDKSGW